MYLPNLRRRNSAMDSKALKRFCHCLSVLEGGNFQKAKNDEIYRLGMLCLFQLTVELACMAIRSALEQSRVRGTETKTNKEILRLAASTGLLYNEAVWMRMLKAKNPVTQVYTTEEANEMMSQLRSCFIPAFRELRETLGRFVK